MTPEGRARAQKLAHEYWEAYVSYPARNDVTHLTAMPGAFMTMGHAGKTADSFRVWGVSGSITRKGA